MPHHHSPHCRSGAYPHRRSFLTQCLTPPGAEVDPGPGNLATMRRLRSCIALRKKEKRVNKHELRSDHPLSDEVYFLR